MRPQHDLQEMLIAMERAALDRWTTFDPEGYLDLSAPEITYFDPYQEKRVDGLEALTTIPAPIKQFKGAIKEPQYEMVAPKVQHHGDVALLTFNLINYGRRCAGDRVGSVECHRGLLLDWRAMEAHSQPLVIH